MTSQPLHRLLYISTARQPFRPDELDTVLRRSRQNNGADGVTGLLITGGRRFLQALEGPADAVARTFARIKADPRHFAIVTLASGPIAERTFAEWSMGHRAGSVNAADDADVATLIVPVADPALRGYFEGFVQTHGQVRAA